MLRRFFQRVYGNSVIVANLPRQRQIPYLPQEQLWRLRDARLKRTVRYAFDTVPYYRQLFRELRVDPRDIECVADLEHLPLLERNTVRENPQLFISTSRLGKNSIDFHTRGSTGFPVTVAHDVHSLIANIAFGERERDVITKVCDRSLGYREMYLGFPGWNIDTVWAFYNEWTFVPVRPRRVVVSIAEPIEQIVEQVNSFRPDVIMGIGSYLELFFRTVVSKALRIHCPRVLIYAGDTMSPAGKSFIEQELNIPVITQYNAIECFKIGFSCEMRKDLHIHEDLCHVRIIDREGHSSADGEAGEVVISNLLNRGTVLLNYRLGDIASISREKCPCGRTLRCISQLQGRLWDILYLPNGDELHPRVIWEVFKGRDDILRYQFIQHGRTQFDLKMFAKDMRTYEQNIHEIETKLREILGSSADIKSHFSQDLAASTGKFRSVVSFYRPAESRTADSTG